VVSPDELHDLLVSLPLFEYMDIEVTALARHPSAIGPAGPTATDQDPPS
jgi:muconolactone D-isomerase